MAVAVVCNWTATRRAPKRLHMGSPPNSLEDTMSLAEDLSESLRESLSGSSFFVSLLDCLFLALQVWAKAFVIYI